MNIFFTAGSSNQAIAEVLRETTKDKKSELSLTKQFELEAM